MQPFSCLTKTRASAKAFSNSASCPGGQLKVTTAAIPAMSDSYAGRGLHRTVDQRTHGGPRQVHVTVLLMEFDRCCVLVDFHHDISVGLCPGLVELVENIVLLQLRDIGRLLGELRLELLAPAGEHL